MFICGRSMGKRVRIEHPTRKLPSIKRFESFAAGLNADRQVDPDERTQGNTMPMNVVAGHRILASGRHNRRY